MFWKNSKVCSNSPLLGPLLISPPLAPVCGANLGPPQCFLSISAAKKPAALCASPAGLNSQKAFRLLSAWAGDSAPSHLGCSGWVPGWAVWGEHSSGTPAAPIVRWFGSRHYFVKIPSFLIIKKAFLQNCSQNCWKYKKKKTKIINYSCEAFQGLLLIRVSFLSSFSIRLPTLPVVLLSAPSLPFSIIVPTCRKHSLRWG